MVSAYRTDALRDPTAELKELFATHESAHDFAPEVTRHFSTVFSSSEAFAEIPTLDVQNPPESYSDRSLVRFRAMVQDTSPSPGMYLRRNASGTLGGWGLHEDVSEEEERNVDVGELRECTTVWAVSIPGESDWCQEELSGSSGQSSQTHTPAKSYKYPDPEGSHIGVQVKLYDLDVAEQLKSTDLATFVGILTKEPMDVEAESPPDVPTLHVLFTRPHQQSLVERPYPSAGSSSVREELVNWIASEALGGDVDAAEWVLLASIARVQSRNPPLLPPSVTLAQFPAPPISTQAAPSEAEAPALPNPALSHVLSQLLPLTHTLPLSLATLNKVPFAPESKDEDLHAGALQLPQGTLLLVTEGGVREGKLVERGLRNIVALQELLAAQTLSYTFPFSAFAFPTDIACVVLTEGTKSAFFRTDLTVPLRPAADARLYKPRAEVALPEATKLAAFRDLVVGAQQGKVQVSAAISEYIQQDFVRDRQQDKAITSEDLIRRMTVAKLYALSMHQTELTVDIWERAKAFDERRRARLAEL
ncbi:mini-chromosome maintenance complex-binding protein [Phanerochaete sordida]|uniref:Mini-chromosome maintenance complex-binding protein n=1 Tax=Phanerochaete sordida TaxID=48140 RepID=A0A9P3G0N9_9APHY|nr:mini-chromosome maintenance complex-binding protein [Phanerochaete sordida]